MEKDLSDYRKSYEKFELLLSDVPSHPIELFEKWFAEVDKRYPENENNAMTISTTGKDGFPKSRVVLLIVFLLARCGATGYNKRCRRKNLERRK